MKNIKELLNTEMSDKEALIATLCVPAISIGLLCLTSLFTKSDSLIAKAKESAQNQALPRSSEIIEFIK